MTTKRPHTKSRNGCQQCKKRHVKCDETGPPCANCAARKTECSYRSLVSLSDTWKPNSWSNRLNSTHSTSTKQGASFLDFDSNLNQPFTPPSTRLRELELMQHWCTKTCHSFTTEHSEIFQTGIVKEALKHECLMQAILAFSSAHIAWTMSDPAGAAPYIRTALQYQSDAISALHSALHDLSPSRCGAIFTSSMIIMACAIVLPLLSHADSGQDKAVSSIESVLHLFEFLKGIISVVNISRCWLKDGPFKTFFQPRFGVHYLSPSERYSFIQRLHVFNDKFHSMMDPSRYQAYQRAIDSLEIIFTTNKLKAFQWLKDAGEDVVDGLQKKEPMALIMFLHWGAILGQLDELWWAKFLGETIVNELSICLSKYELGLGDVTRWIKIQVGQKGEVSGVMQ